MNNFNFVILCFIIVFVFYKYNDISEGIRNTLYFDNDANYQYIMDIDKKECASFDCQNINENEEVLLIGKSLDDKHIFKHKNILDANSGKL